MPVDVQIRWKNLGKEAIELPWVRLNTGLIDKNGDDLLDHVFLKGSDGKPAPARPHAPVRAGGPRLDRSVVLGPGKTHDEIIDLWTYVERPSDGRYQLSIELDIEASRRGRDWQVKTWSGKIQSNVLDVTVGK